MDGRRPLIGVTGSSLVGTVAVIVFALADGGGGGATDMDHRRRYF
jgi:hypothetical protein